MNIRKLVSTSLDSTETEVLKRPERVHLLEKRQVVRLKQNNLGIVDQAKVRKLIHDASRSSWEELRQ